MSDNNTRAGSFQRGRDGRWHEYHGVGSVSPDGSCEFDDNTDSGYHSHTVHAAPVAGSSYVTGHRHQGARYPSDFCDDPHCDDRYGSYRAGYGGGRISPYGR